MAKRHIMKDKDLELIIGRLEELVLANSGQDEFEEVFKILIVKLYSELKTNPRLAFRIYDTHKETVEKFNEILARASTEWKGILPSSPLSKLHDEHLVVCMQAIQSVPLLDTDLSVLDAVFEYLVSKSSKGAKGQFFTPRHIIECCVRILRPQPRETIADPACGSGGFLIHSMKYMQTLHPNNSMKEYCSNRIWGFDFDHRAVRIAKALMLIAGDGNSNLYNLNSLLTPEMNMSLSLFDSEEHDVPRLTIEDIMRSNLGATFKGFDIILTNPPFAGEIKEKSILSQYELSRKDRRMERDTLFIERCIDLLKPAGRIAIVLPHNKLGGMSWEYMREWLVRKLRIVSVLGLGRHSFLPHTHQKTGIIFGVKREKSEKKPGTEKILFMVNEREGKDSRGKFILRKGSPDMAPSWDNIDHDFNDIVSLFNNYVADNAISWG